MNEEIPYYWCGTTWDFNGTTQIPKSGAIACGYFVTTVLKQIGFNLNRVKLAQQASSVMIKSLCKNIQKANGFEVFKEKVKSLPDSTISIVGLDFHVGFILKGKDGNSYFLHSNYINSSGVVKENIDSSIALKSSKYFVLGSISDNDVLLRQWIRS